MIITRTPFRISFFGGGTDYPTWFREHGGAVLATSIDKYCYITCRRLPPFFEHRHRIVYSYIENVREISEIKHPAVRAVFGWANVTDGLEIHHDGDLPARSGLGSSSSFTVGLIHAIHALSGKLTEQRQLASEAIHVEQRVIGEHVGSQDQVSAAVGGFNLIQFNRDESFDVTPVTVGEGRLFELQSHLMLFFTGISRFASDIAKTKIDNLLKKTSDLIRMREMVDEGIAVLSDKDKPIHMFGELLHEGWMRKRSLSSMVSNSYIDSLYEEALKNGALGGKLLGAGGGGFLLLFVPPQRKENVRVAIQGRGIIEVPFKFENSGSKVVLYQPHGL